MKPPRHDSRLKGPEGVRSKGRIIGIIIHTTEMGPREGKEDRHDIVNFLARKGKSVPVVVDPGGGSTIMVPLGHLGSGHAAGLTGKAWGVEQVGFARWKRKTWVKPSEREMVAETAAWAAWALAELMDLPVTKKNLRRFVVGHGQDHKLGGSSDHTDPGPNYPWALFRADAIAYAGDRQNEGEFQYRLVATKDDEKVSKTFRVKFSTRAQAWFEKKAKLGWKVVAHREKIPADPH